jgi:hypothetical protein
MGSPAISGLTTTGSANWVRKTQHLARQEQRAFVARRACGTSKGRSLGFGAPSVIAPANAQDDGVLLCHLHEMNVEAAARTG